MRKRAREMIITLFSLHQARVAGCHRRLRFEDSRFYWYGC